MIESNYWTEATINRSCPLCNAQELHVISRKMQHHLDLTTVICCRCGFVFTNPVPPENVYNQFYADAYADYYGTIAGSAPTGFSVREPAIWGDILDKIHSLQPLNLARLLEVGPGKGQFLYWAKRRGADVLGAEPSLEFHSVLQRNNLPSINTTLEKLDPHGVGTFDVIAMFHVLEHFYDPNRALHRCRDLLNDGGLLAIVVPNILKPYRSLDRYFLRYVHLSNFSPQTLAAILEKHGFKIEIVTTQGQHWYQPQNILVVARNLADIPAEISLPTQRAEEVENLLKTYRRQWMWINGPRWHLWHKTRGLRRLPWRAARYAKRKLNGE